MLSDAPRPGTPGTFTVEQVAAVENSFVNKNVLNVVKTRWKLKRRDATPAC